jgi:hypothetical protein
MIRKKMLNADNFITALSCGNRPRLAFAPFQVSPISVDAQLTLTEGTGPREGVFAKLAC